MAQPAPEAETPTASVIAPPPLIFAGVLTIALFADLIYGGPSLSALLGVPDFARRATGFLLILLGLVLPLAAVVRFHLAGTEVVPWKPSTALVTSGIYRYSRNPMYVGMALIYVGLSIIADSVYGLIGLLPALVIMTYGVIRREEHYLEVTFGEPYRAYKQQVRRWV
jgi:protein-S-isoprenylcysteine O-methyltransferase Ste14